MFEKTIIVELDDLTKEGDNSFEWGFYLYANIVKHIKQEAFTIYYSDGYEIITTWFPGHMFSNYISLNLIARNNCESSISATKIREALAINNDALLKEALPKAVYTEKELLLTFINLFK